MPDEMIALQAELDGQRSDIETPIMRFIIILTSALAVPVAAGAQPVDSFCELAELIEIGRDAAVATSPDGDVIEGPVVDVSPTSVSVFIEGSRVELDEARVLRVRQRWDDPTWDGSLVGFTAGSAPLLVMYALWWQSEGPSSGPRVRRDDDAVGRTRRRRRVDRGHPRWRPDERDGAVSAPGVDLAAAVAGAHRCSPVDLVVTVSGEP